MVKKNNVLSLRNKLYFTAPSRSGSSLLVTLLNCLDDVIVVNEPANSYKIDEPSKIIGVYESLQTEATTGLVNQRVNFEGEEITDTFPNDKITWQRISVKYSENLIIRIKKSFPSFGNKDYHLKFIDEW